MNGLFAKFAACCLAGFLTLSLFAADSTSPSANTPAQKTPAAEEKPIFPRSRETIKKVMHTIETRKVEKGKTNAEEQKALNYLNTVRYLCGLDSDVVMDATYRAEAEEAAKACEAHGNISHELGHHTNECNLHYQTRGSTFTEQVAAYINDRGEHNRVERGHRMWCLYPEMKKTAFGRSNDYGAMRVNYVHKKQAYLSEGYGYPGKGYYPAKYMLGDGWSYYPPNNVSFKKGAVKLRMWKYKRVPKKLPAMTELPRKSDATEIENIVLHVVDYGLTFEPRLQENKGTYLIRIESDNFSDQYIVSFF